MNRKIIEDVKFKNSNNLSRKSMDGVVFNSIPNSKVYTPVETPHLSSDSKYDFLKKKAEISNNKKQRIYQTPQMPGKRKPFSKSIFFVFLITIAIAVMYLLSTVFLNAKVTVISKNKTFDLKHQKIVAAKNKSNSVPFELMITSDSEFKDVVFTSSLDASIKAKGEINLFNEYSTKAVKLSAGTFIADEKGKTYKIDSTVSIPGYTSDSAKIILPGQISVVVTAFLAGDTYNGSPSDFHIISYKGTTKDTKIYGKLKTPLSGGIAGLVYMLNDQEREELFSKNVASLQDKLLRKLSAEVPQGYILYPNAVSFSYLSDEKIISKNPNTKIEIKGTLSAYLIKENDLSDYLIDKLLPEITPKEKSEIVQPNLSQLAFNFINKDQIVNKDIESFDFDLTGILPVTWKPDIEQLKELLSGKNKNNISEIFKEDPGISSASVKIVPFWSSVLPVNLKNINIIIK